MIYEFKCSNPTCKQHFDIERTVDTRNELASCPKCGNFGTRVMTLPCANVGAGSKIPGICNAFEDPIYIKSKHHLKEVCKERNAEPIGIQ